VVTGRGRLLGHLRVQVRRAEVEAEALVEAVYQDQVERLAASARELLEGHAPAEAFRSWMALLIDWAAAKHGMIDTLRALMSSRRVGPGQMRAQLVEIVSLFLRAGGAAGDLRTDVAATLAGVLAVAAGPDQRAQAGRMPDLVLDGLRPGQVSGFPGLDLPARRHVRPHPATSGDVGRIPPEQQTAGWDPARGARKANISVTVFASRKPVGSQSPGRPDASAATRSAEVCRVNRVRRSSSPVSTSALAWLMVWVLSERPAEFVQCWRPRPSPPFFPCLGRRRDWWRWLSRARIREHRSPRQQNRTP
jgi:hypothetical protein